MQPSTVVQSGDTPLLIQGDFRTDYYNQQNQGIAYYCWFGHKARWFDDYPYSTEAKIVNFTHASCTAPPAPSLSERMVSESDFVEDNTFVYVSASYVPNALSSLSIIYVGDPYVNYTWPNIASSLGHEPTALIGNDFMPDAEYTMAFGPKVGKCHYKSNILLLCDTPPSAGLNGDFPYGNENSVCTDLRPQNNSDIFTAVEGREGRRYLDCKTAFNDTRYPSPVPVGLSVNNMEWANLTTNFWLNNSKAFFYHVPPVLAVDGITPPVSHSGSIGWTPSAAMTLTIPDYGETYLALNGVGVRGEYLNGSDENVTALLLARDQSHEQTHIVCDFGRERVLPVFINTSLTICPTRWFQYDIPTDRTFRLLDLTREAFMMTPFYTLQVKSGFDVVDVVPGAIPIFHSSFIISFKRGSASATRCKLGEYTALL
jgi:hypothetical protein